MKNKKSISGVTLIEILIGIVISMIMMGAMFTSYSVVNSSYSQVSDKAKISQSARNLVGMLVRDVRMAGFKYFNDTITEDTNEHIPIKITKSKNFNQTCDRIDIVYGDVIFDKTKSPQYTYERFKVSYFCEKSKIIDKARSTPTNMVTVDAFAVYKEKRKWDSNGSRWLDPDTDVRPGSSAKDQRTYSKEKVVDYVQDLVFHAIDGDGKLISPPPTATNATKDKVYKIKTVDIALTKRSSKEFFRDKKIRSIKSMEDASRNISKNDKYLRESIIISANTRNLGLL